MASEATPSERPDSTQLSAEERERRAQLYLFSCPGCTPRTARRRALRQSAIIHGVRYCCDCAAFIAMPQNDPTVRGRALADDDGARPDR